MFLVIFIFNFCSVEEQSLVKWVPYDETAELKENQKDTDNLPEYEILDEILKGLVEREISVEKIISKGFERKIVEKTAQLLARSEYKRFQAAPGPKVTSKAFGRDRRFPLTSGFRNWN